MAGLALRLARLEKHPGMWSKSQRRAMLAHSFTAPEYAEHRERIIEALCGDCPQYSFRGPAPNDPDEYAAYMVSWWTREQGFPPYVMIYPGTWMLDANVGREDEQDETPEE